MFPAAPHSAAHGDRCHHGKEGDKSCGETLGERIQASWRLLPGRSASPPLQKCCACAPKCLLGILILIPLGGLGLPCTLMGGQVPLEQLPLSLCSLSCWQKEELY